MSAELLAEIDSLRAENADLEAELHEAEASARRAHRRSTPQRDQRFLDEGDVPADDDDQLALIGLWASRHALLLDELWRDAYLEGWQNFAAQFPLRAADPPAIEAIFPDAAAMSLHKVSVARMTGELSGMVHAGATADDLAEWFDSNEHRIDLQARGLAWAAEQHGYKEAGAGRGMEIDWELDDGVEHCGDCPDLADGGPYTDDDGDNPLPAFPGAGGTECGSNCYCSLNYREPDTEALAA